MIEKIYPVSEISLMKKLHKYKSPQVRGDRFASDISISFIYNFGIATMSAYAAYEVGQNFPNINPAVPVALGIISALTSIQTGHRAVQMVDIILARHYQKK